MNSRSRKRALIFQGGWTGHQPHVWANHLAQDLGAAGLAVEIVDSLEPLEATSWLQEFALVVPCWTMGVLTPAQTRSLVEVVRAGTGLGGIHGGMGDAFRGNLDYEWMVGGHFLGHPHVGPYTVELEMQEHPITRGLPLRFDYDSEQYYMAIDPAVEVLASSEYSLDEGTCRMPVAWKRQWGAGRVFYSALGHDPAEFHRHPAARELTRRGLLWAAGENL